MFGDLFGDIESRQNEIKEKLSALEISESAGDGAVKVTVNGNKEVVNLSIDQNKLALDDVEELEDLLLIVLNRALERAGEEQEKMSRSLINEMLPPGFGGLFGQ